MSECQKKLMKAGKPYPRTCAICGLLGGCIVDPPEPKPVPMTPPLPPPGYELVEDEPRARDMAWVFGEWRRADRGVGVVVPCDDDAVYIPARDLRWIARKI